MSCPVLLVFSHLRWRFVHQRPQHLLSRLAGRWRVIFVEEPVLADGPARLVATRELPELTVLVPHTPIAAPGFHDDQLAVLQGLLSSWLQVRRLEVDVAWLYTPMALPLVKTVQPTCVVYDCMDELAAFKDAPRQMRQRESALLKQATLVLTGGPSLYDAKRHLHPHVYCIPSAVDAAHFAACNLRPGSEHDRQAETLQGALPRPRLGFFGVIDERLDLGLIALLADTHAHWQVVMVGPVAKIDPASLPRRPNIHWLGEQPYARLPYLLAGWDLCLMPFALNDATRFISPTKTLEYLAGDKPVVSTPISDVISLYGHSVVVAPAGLPFVQACDMLLSENAAAHCRRAIDMLNTVATHSWDRSADAVHALVTTALAQARAELTPLRPPPPAPVRAAAGR